MSNTDQSRRTAAEVFFDGTDITASIRPYMRSLVYTDNEEDEADDLQITLQDRDGIWQEQWLNDAVQAAADVSSGGQLTQHKRYRVTAKIGLNVRTGPGNSYSRYGALCYGESVSITGASGGWATIQYRGKTGYLNMEYLEPLDDAQVPEDTHKIGSLKIKATILRQNWHGDGTDSPLDCGQFELDSLDSSGPPATVTIKATSLPFSSHIRQTQRSQAWEAYTLSGIANEMAQKNGLAFLFESMDDPFYERVEQVQQSDIAFLSELCHRAGISLKVTGNILVLFDQRTYEAAPTVRTIRKGDLSYSKYRLKMGKAGTQYASCRVSYFGPDGCIEATAYVEDYKADREKNQQLEITAKVGSIAEAHRLAEKMLRLHNKYERSATFTLPGDPTMLAGVTVQLDGWGAWDGKYIINQARHSVGGSGYSTQIQLRSVMDY